MEAHLFTAFWPGITNMHVKSGSVESSRHLVKAEMREAESGPWSAPDASCKLGQHLSPCIFLQNDDNNIYAFPRLVRKSSLLSSGFLKCPSLH